MNHNNMFYTEAELCLAVSKLEMNSVEIGKINIGDTTIDCKIGNEWKEYSIAEFLELAFTDGKNLVATADDGGLLIHSK